MARNDRILDRNDPKDERQYDELKYKTFDTFCAEELGFSRQTIYVYISILKLINAFPNYFPRSKVIDFGHKKMRYITEGTNAIDRKITDEDNRNKAKVEIFTSVSPKMASTEIESKIKDIVQAY